MQLLSIVAAQAYPGVTHYANSHVFTDIQADGILEVVEKAMAKPSSLFNLIVVDYGEDGASTKSNEDTAYSWRGKWVMYIWSFWTRTDGVPPVGPCVNDIISRSAEGLTWAVCLPDMQRLTS